MSIAQSLGAHEWRRGLYSPVKRCRWLRRIQSILRAQGASHSHRLFVYVARGTGRYMLGYWVDRRLPTRRCGKAFVALTGLVGPPDMVPFLMPPVPFLQARIRPARRQAIEGLKAIREEAYAEREAERHQREMKNEWIRYVGKKDPLTAHLAKAGKIPLHFANDQGPIVEAIAKAAAAKDPKPTILIDGFKK